MPMALWMGVILLDVCWHCKDVLRKVLWVDLCCCEFDINKWYGDIHVCDYRFQRDGVDVLCFCLP